MYFKVSNFYFDKLLHLEINKAMASYLVKTLFIVFATTMTWVKAEKMDFNYRIDSSQTTCFLEHIGESVQGKSSATLTRIRFNTFTYSDY